MTVLNILSAGAAKGVVLALQDEFSATREVSFNSTFGAAGAIKAKLLAGEPCDLIILTAAMIEALLGQGLVYADSVAALGRVYTGIAVPSTLEKPDIGDAAALRSALLDARGIYLPDPERATAGIHFANVLRSLGIYESIRAWLRPFPSGAIAMREMADAGEPDLIGCTQVTEIKYTAGVSLVGLLPKEFELATTYTVAVCVNAAEPFLARKFAALLTGEKSQALRVRGGFVIK